MDNLSQHKVDVVIVGAGMVGAALALALSSASHLKVAIIDAAPPVESPKHGISKSLDDYDVRVSAITGASQELLSQLGVWPTIEAIGASAYQHMYVWDAEGTGSVSFDAGSIHRKSLGHIVENSVIQYALQDALSKRENVTARYSESVSTMSLGELGGRVLLASGDSFEGALIVAADGANSRLRQMSGLPVKERDYQHHALVCTIKTEKDHQNTAWQRFIDTGPLAFLPLSGSDRQHSSIVWSVTPELADDLSALQDEEFKQRLSLASERILGDVESVSRRFRVPLRERHAKEYVKQGFALVGDAAHTIHPLAGQGVNLGFGDVMALAEEVLRADSLGLSIGDIRVLKRFERRRQGENLLMMKAMEGFRLLFSQEDIAVRWLRNTGMKLFDKAPMLKQEVIARAMGLNTKVPAFSSELTET